MRARALAEPYPSVRTTDRLATAVDLVVGRDLPALLITDPEGRPVAVLRADQVLAACLPGYFADDPLLVRLIDEPYADRMGVAPERLVSECLPRGGPRPFSVTAECTVVEVAELMARTGCPVVAVLEGGPGPDTRLLGVVTATRVLQRLRSRAHA